MDLYFKTLHQRIETLAEGYPLPELRKAYNYIEQEYRGGGDIGALSELSLAVAYSLARLPATFRVIHRLLGDIRQFDDHFQAETLLDAGSGPGAVLFAAQDVWPQVSALALEREQTFINVAQQLAGSETGHVWQKADISRALPQEKFDLVTASYALGELSPKGQERFLKQLPAVCEGYVLLIEPGTPAGAARIRQARRTLTAGGLKLFAPCCSEAPCPSEWCHFSMKIARSKIHRLLKGGSLGYEFEHYCYLLAGVPEMRYQSQPRLIERPKVNKAEVAVTVCSRTGQFDTVKISRRSEPERYKLCKKLDWGDILPE